MKRARALEELHALVKRSPVVALLGPRQAGKTSLALELARNLKKAGPVTRYDLEDPVEAARLENPKLELEGLEGLVIIDEVQMFPTYSLFCAS